MKTPLLKPTRTSLLFIFIILNSLQTFSQNYAIPGHSFSSPVLIAEFDNKMLFRSKENGNWKLWISDGTENGTCKLSSDGHSFSRLIAANNDVAYFLEKEGDKNYISALAAGDKELTTCYETSNFIQKILFWRDDIYFTQEQENSYRVNELIKLNTDNYNIEQLFKADYADVTGLGASNNEVIFIANMNEGTMLGKTDGTLANTEVFHKISEKSTIGTNYFSITGGNKMYFTYISDLVSHSLWVTDGSSEGTIQLKEYDSDSGWGENSRFATLNGKLFHVFSQKDSPMGVSYDLNVTDGTVEGTKVLLNPSYNAPSYLDPRYLTLYNDKLYFCGRTASLNYALFSVDGDSSVVKKEIGVRTSGFGTDETFRWIIPIAKYRNNLVMVADNDKYGEEIFSYDGSESKILLDIEPGDKSGSPDQIMQAGNSLFFTLYNDNSNLYVYNEPCKNFRIERINVLDASDTNKGSIDLWIYGAKPYEIKIVSPSSTIKTNYSYVENLSPGIYDVFVTDANGCFSKKRVEVKEYTCANFKFDSLIVKDETDYEPGEIKVAVSGGTNPYAFSLDSSSYSDLNDFLNISAGDHVISVRDSNRCQIDTIFNVGKITCTNFVFDSILLKNITGNSIGEIILNATGGRKPYNYKLDDQAVVSDSNFVNLKMGEHHLQVFDANGCIADTIVVFQDKTLIQDIASVSNFKIFPNPVYDNSLNIQIDLVSDIEQGLFEIYQINGREIYREKKHLKKGASIHTIPLKNVATGEYLLTIKANNSVICSGKVIIY